jgi:hypothetical protein
MLYHCIYGCMFCTLLFNFVNYLFLLLCYICQYFYYHVMCSFVSLSILIVIYVPFFVFCLIMLFFVLFLCKCVLYNCHRVPTQLQLKKIIYHPQCVHPWFTSLIFRWDLLNCSILTISIFMIFRTAFIFIIRL